MCPSALVLFICLIYRFSINPPTILHSYCEGLYILFVEVIFCGDVRIFIPNSATFSFVREKKNRQTNRETNANLRIYCLYKPREEGGGNIFCLWSGCLLKMSEILSPIVHSFHLCGKINRQTNRQTNKPLSFDCVHKPGGLIIFARGADIV